MASLAQLLASHRRILLLDAASLHVTTGLLQSGQSAIWSATESEAGRGIFSGTTEVLERGSVRLDEVDAFIFCEGPGSMLGTRTVAMALRTWQTLRSRPVYAYQSLAVAAHAEWKHRPRSFAVLADARRETWHVQAISSAGTLAPLERRSTSELAAGELLTPAHFRAWSTPPAGISECPYDLGAIAETLGDANLFQLAALPDAFQSAAPDYKKWSAQTHSAETAVRKS